MTVYGRCSHCKISAICVPTGLEGYMQERLQETAFSRGVDLRFGDSLVLNDHVRTILCLSMTEIQEEIPYGCAYRYKLEIKATIGPGAHFKQTVQLRRVNADKEAKKD